MVLLLGDILLLTRSAVGLFFLVLTRNWFIFLLISLRVLVWRIEVAGVFLVVLFLASAVVAGLWSEWACARWWWHVHLLVVIVHLLLVLDVGWYERLGVAPLAAEWLRSRERHWGWSEVLVWVEAAKSNDICQA